MAINQNVVCFVKDLVQQSCPVLIQFSFAFRTRFSESAKTEFYDK
jgi:hypothetical protein